MYKEDSLGLIRLSKNNKPGYVGKNGYRYVSIDSIEYLEHRLVWILHFGPINKTLIIDHINGNKEDNRISNLRIGSQSQNCQNRRKASSRSKTGVIGVSIKKRKGKIKYRAAIKIKGKVIERLFDDIEQARDFYLSMKRVNHEFCTI